MTGLPLVEEIQNRPFDLPKREDSRPDVFLLNHASAYSAWYQVRRRMFCVSGGTVSNSYSPPFPSGSVCPLLSVPWTLAPQLVHFSLFLTLLLSTLELCGCYFLFPAAKCLSDGGKPRKVAGRPEGIPRRWQSPDPPACCPRFVTSRSPRVCVPSTSDAVKLASPFGVAAQYLCTFLRRKSARNGSGNRAPYCTV